MTTVGAGREAVTPRHVGVVMDGGIDPFDEALAHYATARDDAADPAEPPRGTQRSTR